MSAPLLEVDGLTVTFPTARGPVDVVKGISFSLSRERLGIVGESGSGKSMTGRSILRLIRPPGRVAARKMRFDGIDLLDQSERQMRHLRGAAIIMASVKGKLSAAGIMKNLPVAFRLNDNGSSDGSQNVCAPDKVSGAQATSLLSWYVFLPACVQANSALPEPAARVYSAPAPAPARPLW